MGANQLHGKEVEILVGAVILEMLCDADFRSNDEFLFVGALGVLNDARGGTDVVRLLTHGGDTFGMHEQLGVGIERLGTLDLLHCDGGVDRASAVEQLDVFVGALLRDEAAQVAVRNKENIFVVNLLNNLHGRGACDADVADCFELCRGVDIGDDRMVGIIFFDRFNHFSVHLICHIAARERLRKQHGLFWREQLAGFCHKAHAAHQNRLIGHLGGVDAQLIAVARIVGDFADFSRLITVSQNTNILFLF